MASLVLGSLLIAAFGVYWFVIRPRTQELADVAKEKEREDRFVTRIDGSGPV